MKPANCWRPTRTALKPSAKALMRYETLDASEVDRVMKGEILTKPTVGDLLEKEQSRRGTVIQPAPDPKGPDLTLGGGPLPAPG